MAGTVKVENGNAIFELTGADKILAIKSRLIIPLSHITSVSTERGDWNTFQMLKVAGARLPGIVVDGRFISKEGFLFYEMHDPDKVITVGLVDERYKKIIFEVDDKEATAKELLASLPQLKHEDSDKV
ncbi:MAG: hypothetical protein ACREBW_02085 [Candidatus Micrarchaeaceae archaeon]